VSLGVLKPGRFCEWGKADFTWLGLDWEFWTGNEEIIGVLGTYTYNDLNKIMLIRHDD
jgi:hypothetical protein